MRSRRLALTTVAILAGCAQSSAPVEPPSGPLQPEPASIPEASPLRRSPTLAGATVETSRSEGWTYRRAGGRNAEGRAFGARSASHGGAAPAASAAPAGADAADEPVLLRDVETKAKWEGAATGGGGGGGDGAPAEPPADPAAPTPSPPAADASVRRERAHAESAAKSLDSRAPAEVRALRAGATDDNAEFPKFLEFLAGWGGRQERKGLFQPLDVRDRRFVRVVDGAGRPVPAASVSVVDAERDRVVGRATTYGDGRAPIYPRAAVAEGDDGRAPPSGWIVEVRAAGRTVRTSWDGAGDEFTVTVAEAPKAPDLVPIDVAFVIDTTGSMGDEIASIQASLLRVTEQIRSLSRESDLRVGTVLYRDVGDEYLTATWPLTQEVGELDKALRGVTANGGGDGPESLNQGLAEAVEGLAWRDGAAKVAFLVADAPPHMDYAGDTPYGDTVRAAVAKGLRIHTVAASGLDEVGSLVFRQIAQFTRGKFVFIEYGGDVRKSAEAHGIGGAVKNDNLEDILFEQIRDEVALWGRSPPVR